MATNKTRNAGIATALLVALIAGTSLITAQTLPPTGAEATTNAASNDANMDAQPAPITVESATMDCIELDPPTVRPDHCV